MAQILEFKPARKPRYWMVLRENGNLDYYVLYGNPLDLYPSHADDVYQEIDQVEFVAAVGNRYPASLIN